VTLSLLPLMLPLSIWDPLLAIGSAIMQPLYWVVSGILVLFHALWSPVFGPDSGWTWALSIVCLTVLIRIALIPLFVRQINSSRQMQLLQPKVRELQKKYAHDREKLGAETMKLYRENKANPLASCLPLLLQMPIFLALFRVLDGAATQHARGYWLNHHPELLTSLHEATIFGAPLSAKFLPIANGFGSVQLVAIILIVAMTATLFITQLQLMRKNMPPEALEGPFAQQQKMMLYIFPVIFAVGGINFPIGVLIYWLTSNLWTMGQQFYIIRRNPAPGTPAYAAWEARRKLKAAEKAVSDITPPTAAGAVGNGHGPRATAAVDPAPAAETPAQSRVIRQQPRSSSRSQRRK
jgi:YidC/Oxa1 family membrane protein insertase